MPAILHLLAESSKPIPPHTGAQMYRVWAELSEHPSVLINTLDKYPYIVAAPILKLCPEY